MVSQQQAPVNRTLAGGATKSQTVVQDARSDGDPTVYLVVTFRFGLTMVSSATTPGDWHLVEEGRCDCTYARLRPGRARREPCSHVEAIERAAEQQQRTGRA